ncbi:YlxR family protein [Corynebacterium sp. HS2168-gen11]|uniref:YlxR family protein n=1 Tax=Corynebacterium sp. HS2168-gen11 TaxID=2974027 RepID=UPI00216AD6FC|nr:YlxR family protein [Corynebacterium sp. HS2168-gen11]MCS4536320.1 YlxR family protein [Corynebacterium sp. HS2168-gen11]
MRTCIATRTQYPDAQLLRVVAAPGIPTQLIPDPKRRLPGRGCWITPSMSALEIAQQRFAFERALRVSTPVDTGAVRKYLATLTNSTERE